MRYLFLLTAISVLGFSCKKQKENNTIIWTGDPYILELQTFYCPKANTVNVKWDLGDSTISTDKSPSHFYRKPGTYLVTLSTADGNIKIANKIITITNGTERLKGTRLWGHYRISNYNVTDTLADTSFAITVINDSSIVSPFYYRDTLTFMAHRSTDSTLFYEYFPSSHVESSVTYNTHTRKITARGNLFTWAWSSEHYYTK